MLRIERELGEIEHWSVAIAPTAGAFTSRVAIDSGGESLQSTGFGMDGPLAVWEALCKLEQLLRDARARRMIAQPPDRTHPQQVALNGAAFP